MLASAAARCNNTPHCRCRLDFKLTKLCFGQHGRCRPSHPVALVQGLKSQQQSTACKCSLLASHRTSKEVNLSCILPLLPQVTRRVFASQSD
jgi:hypothetical protein